MENKKTKAEYLELLYKQYPSCQSLPIETTGATRIVYGEGNPDSPILFVGEAPGQKEDELGRPFVGRSGMLLTKTLQALGASRDDVFITNVVKCRPPNNRTPTLQEIDLYKKLFLIPEIKIIMPKVIVAVGSIAFKTLLAEVPTTISKARGKIFQKGDFIVIPTYHPAYILRNANELNNFIKDIALALSLIKNNH